MLVLPTIWRSFVAYKGRNLDSCPMLVEDFCLFWLFRVCIYHVTYGIPLSNYVCSIDAFQLYPSSIGSELSLHPSDRKHLGTAKRTRFLYCPMRRFAPASLHRGRAGRSNRISARRTHASMVLDIQCYAAAWIEEKMAPLEFSQLEISRFWVLG